MTQSLDADTVVIGAGAAGLAAARRLASHSLRVIVVEARDRVGGRAWSDPSVRTPVPTELGAEFIHGPAPQTMALLREAGMAAVDTGGDSWTRTQAGDLQLDNRDFMAAAGLFEAARALSHDESVDRFLQRFQDDPAVRENVAAARAFVEGFDAADPSIASVRSIAEEWSSGVDFAIARPLGGYGPIFESLRNACAAAGARVYLSTAVRRISWRPGAVAVEATAASGETRTLRARTAVITLPVGVLRHRGDETAVVFDPALSPAKREALTGVEMGDAIRVALWFQTAFWERLRDGRYRDAGFFRYADGPFAAYWTQYPIRSELIVAWLGGPRATALRDVSPPELIERALGGFAEIFGEPELAHAEFERGVVHDWHRDPFARGAYSYVAVGPDDARAALAAPIEGTLFFAGEATSNGGQGGTVNGALESGERAACEAIAALETAV